MDYIDAMNGMIDKAADSEDVRKGMTVLLTSLNTFDKFKQTLLNSLLDSKSIMDRTMVRVNLEKITEYLVSRVERLSGQCAGLDLSEDQPVPEQTPSRRRRPSLIALELIKAYIPESLAHLLIARLGYDSSLVFNPPVEEHAKQTTGEKRTVHQESKSHQPTAKKMKQVAIAKTCMKMTSFFKPRGT